jgi:PAS domain S-box-containing protein
MTQSDAVPYGVGSLTIEGNLSANNVFRLIVENATDLIVCTDAVGNRIYVSPSSEEMLGFKPAEMMGKHAFELVHPDDLQNASKIATKIGPLHPSQDLTFRMRRIDGGYIWVEGRYRYLQAGGGGILAMLRDITRQKLAEQRLEEANSELELGRQRFDAVLSNIKQGVCFFDGEKRLLLSNCRYGEIYNLPPEATRVGRPMEEILSDRYAVGSAPDPSMSDRYVSEEQILASNQPTSADVTLRNGRCVSIHYQPMPDGGFVATQEDITERQQAKDRAEQAEALLRDAIDSISAGFVIYDREDRFVMCNETYLQEYSQIYPGVAQLLAPGVLFEDMLRHVLTQSPWNADAHGREAEWLAERLLRHREDSRVIERRAANGSWYLVTDRRMKNGGIAGLRIDITALKQAQTALCDSEARLDRAQATAGIGSWELDVPTGRYIWSKELYRIRGVSPEEFTPDIDNVAVYVHPDDYPLVRCWLADLKVGGEPDALETRILRPDGSTRVLRVEGGAVIDPDGVIRRIAGTMQDITERRLIEQQLSQSQKMESLGRLTGGMAHDFNNGLGIIIGNLDLLGRLIKAEPMAKELCDDARDGALRCADLIRRLLSFARRQPLHPQQTDVNALVESTAKLLGRTLGENITLTPRLDGTVWPVVIDPMQLEAALINLATNARDAMPKGGRLDIVTKTAELDAAYTALYPDAHPGEYALIEVSDNGTGIAPDILSQIFEPFFTTKEPGQGTGLGLSMVFGFVKQSGGHLAVYSEPGHGSTFRIYLPRAPVGDAPAVVPTASKPLAAGGNETILVVEDNAPLRRATARQLMALGYQLREAEHAAAALVVLAGSDRVDLLFSDVVMPGTMDGLDLAYEARRLRPGLKVLLTSGFPGVRSADRRMASCPFPLLNKPYPHDALTRAVREGLDRDDEPTSAITVARTSHQIQDDVGAATRFVRNRTLTGFAGRREPSAQQE